MGGTTAEIKKDTEEALVESCSVLVDEGAKSETARAKSGASLAMLS